jgi:hypothetical protein
MPRAKKEVHSSPRRQGFTVTLVPEPGVDGIKALRFVLKSALRKHGLKCTDVSLSASSSKKAEEETQRRKEPSHA